MSLHSIRIHGDDLVERVEGDIADIVVSICEEFAEDIDGHDSESAVRFNVQDSKDCFVQDRIADVLG